MLTRDDGAAADLRAEVAPLSGAALGSLRAEWRELWLRAAGQGPFSHPGWVQTYLAAFEPDAHAALLTVRQRGTLLAALPLIRESAVIDGMPVRVLRAPANPHSFRVTVLAAAGTEAVLPRAIGRCLSALRGWDLFLLPRFPRDEFSGRLCACLRDHRFPVLEFPHLPTRHVLLPSPATQAADEPWLTGVDPDLRKQMRKALRRIRQDFRGEPVLEVVERADPAALGRFYEIEASGWKGREGTAISCAPDTARFYDGVAREFAADGMLRLHALSIGGVLLAGAFSVVSGDRLFVLKWAYDEAYAGYRPGHLLSREMLRDCAGRGLQVMDLGEEAEYKRAWTPHTQPHASVYVFNRTAYGRLLAACRRWLRPAAGRLLGLARRAAARSAPRTGPGTG